MRKYSLLFMLLLLSGSVNAEIVAGSPETGNGCGANCFWSFDTETGVLDITGSGKMDDFNIKDITSEDKNWKPAPWYDFRDSLTILNVSGVESVGADAFYRSSLVSINIADTVTSLGIHAFIHNHNLKDVRLSNNLETIVGSGFTEDYALESIILPDTLQMMGDWQFNNDHKLSYLELSENLTSLGQCALKGTAIETLVIPASVTDISDELFYYKEYPDSVTSTLKELYCTSAQMSQCEVALIGNKSQFKPTRYEKEGNDYMVYDDKGNVVGKYASIGNLQKGMATETYKYDSAGHLVGIFDSNGQRTWGKKIYTIEEAMEVTAHGDKFHVYLTYK